MFRLADCTHHWPPTRRPAERSAPPAIAAAGGTIALSSRCGLHPPGCCCQDTFLLKDFKPTEDLRYQSFKMHNEEFSCAADSPTAEPSDRSVNVAHSHLTKVTATTATSSYASDTQECPPALLIDSQRAAAPFPTSTLSRIRLNILTCEPLHFQPKNGRRSLLVATICPDSRPAHITGRQRDVPAERSAPPAISAAGGTVALSWRCGLYPPGCYCQDTFLLRDFKPTEDLRYQSFKMHNEELSCNALPHRLIHDRRGSSFNSGTMAR